MTRRNSTAPHSSTPNFSIDLEHKYKKHSATHSHNHAAQMLTDVLLHFLAASVPKPRVQAAQCSHTTHEFMAQGSSSCSTASRNINVFGGSCGRAPHAGWGGHLSAQRVRAAVIQMGIGVSNPPLSWMVGADNIPAGICSLRGPNIFLPQECNQNILSRIRSYCMYHREHIESIEPCRKRGSHVL